MLYVDRRIGIEIAIERIVRIMEIVEGGVNRGIAQNLKGNGRSEIYHSWDLGLLLPRIKTG